MPKRPRRKPRPSRSATGPLRRFVRRASLVAALLFGLLCALGGWYVHHPAAWLAEKNASLPGILTVPLVYFGDRTAFFTDAIGLTGCDVVYDFDEDAPEGRIFFAGAPLRTGGPAPSDIRILARDEFAVGWSPSLGHAVWAAYHVPRVAPFESGARPNFRKDPEVPESPSAAAYEHTGYDRGHLVPNHAIETRFGPEEQRKTFYMTNVAPQRPGLNRGPWREIEHRIAELWTARYGELWVQVGTLPAERAGSCERLSGSRVEVPEAFWCLITAQDEDGVRVLAFILPQTVSFDAFPVHYIVSVDEIERRSGLDLMPELPGFLAKPLEAETPTRLWPIRLADVFRLIALRFPAY